MWAEGVNESLSKKISKKLELLQDKDVEQIVYDVLHMKRSKFPDMNIGQHSDYKAIVKELKEGYQMSIEKLKQQI